MRSQALDDPLNDATDIGRAVGFPEDDLYIVGRQIDLGEVRVSDHRLQDIVEIVRDPARQRAHRVELLHARDLSLERFNLLIVALQRGLSSDAENEVGQ